MKIPHDYHIHTGFSSDSRASMSEMCAAALAAGVGEIGIADHHDLHPYEQPCSRLELEAWSRELDACRRKFEGLLVIRAGVEIGEPHRFGDLARVSLADYPFDYLLGSLHWVGDGNVFSPEFFARSEAEAYADYFAELERMTRAGGFDIVAHFDVTIRTGFAYYGNYDPSRYEDVIRQTLRNCIERGIALEVNTGTLRRSAGVLNPDPQILAWYREMGGERITLGSDAHRADHVGAGLPLALEAAIAAGFRYATGFEGRRARMMPLD